MAAIGSGAGAEWVGTFIQLVSRTCTYGAQNALAACGHAWRFFCTSCIRETALNNTCEFATISGLAVHVYRMLNEVPLKSNGQPVFNKRVGIERTGDIACFFFGADCVAAIYVWG